MPVQAIYSSSKSDFLPYVFLLLLHFTFISFGYYNLYRGKIIHGETVEMDILKYINIVLLCKILEKWKFKTFIFFTHQVRLNFMRFSPLLPTNSRNFKWQVYRIKGTFKGLESQFSELKIIGKVSKENKNQILRSR